MPGRHWIVTLGLLSACEHPAPFTYTAPTEHGPHQPGNPFQLTFNPGVDEKAGWLPGDTAIIYSQQQSGVPGPERCLATIPAAGGTIDGQLCAPVAALADSAIAFEPGQVASDGRLVYVRISVPTTSPGLSVAGVVRVSSLTTSRDILAFPYLSPSGRSIDAVSNARWASPTSVLVLAEHFFLVTCTGCAPDTVRWGQEIDRIDFAGPTPSTSVLPGTDDASSFTLSGADTLYFTVNGDTRIHRRLLSTGVDSVVFDFGATGIARDVSVAAGTIAVVVGGSVSFQYDSAALQFIQIDHGGRLHALVGDSDRVLTDSTTLARRPAISGNGSMLVAELRPPFPPGPPLTQLPTTDLWVWRLR